MALAKANAHCDSLGPGRELGPNQKLAVAKAKAICDYIGLGPVRAPSHSGLGQLGAHLGPGFRPGPFRPEPIWVWVHLGPGPFESHIALAIFVIEFMLSQFEL